MNETIVGRLAFRSSWTANEWGIGLWLCCYPKVACDGAIGRLSLQIGPLNAEIELLTAEAAGV